MKMDFEFAKRFEKIFFEKYFLGIMRKMMMDESNVTWILKYGLKK